MLAASTDIAGWMIRSEKSSSESVSSAVEKFIATCFCVETCNVTLVSAVSCADITAPDVTVYWFGNLIFRLSPILAPSLANESS